MRRERVRRICRQGATAGLGIAALALAAAPLAGQGLPRAELRFPEGRTSVELPLERQGRR